MEQFGVCGVYTNIKEGTLMTKPNINVTPLIDVLLVMLIIFMVAAPMKPTAFKANIPAEPKNISPDVKPHPHTLVVSLDHGDSISLNGERGLGNAQDQTALIYRLKAVVEERKRLQAEYAVFIRAPRTAEYGKVAKVIDAVKLSGASPIALQIDHLD
ncbi:MAG: biopolymer transporter ExbD [Acidobacteriota bacterium]|nr:MAG: biopolymer transporter ExbD [Acidobacteriota bacterium]